MSLLARRLEPERTFLRFRLPSIRLPWWALLLLVGGQLLAHALGGVWWLLRRPWRAALLGAVVGGVYVFRVHGPAALYVPAMLAALALFVWSRADEASFDRWAEAPAVALWRRLTVYRREWQPAMTTAGLALPSSMGDLLPVLLRVRRVDGVDVVRVRTNPGQTLERWAAAAEQLARTFRVLDVRVRTVPGRVGELELRCLVHDPLERPVPIIPPAEAVDLRAIPVGVREDGTPFRLPLLGTHLLVAGATGAGKGSALWSLLLGVAPAIRSGLVRVWAIDPKGGLELGAGAPLFHRFAYGGPTANGAPWQEAIAELLEDRVRGMQARLARLRNAPPDPVTGERPRKLEPTIADPLLLIVVDELASLTAYVTDPALRRRIADALQLLLSQGRAAAVVVVGATQDPRKETLPMRSLFPTRLALRTVEAAEADLILGEGARARGARTDRIRASTPGVGYVIDEDAPEPVRVRLSHVTDDAIAAAAEEYATTSSGTTLVRATAA